MYWFDYKSTPTEMVSIKCMTNYKGIVKNERICNGQFEDLYLYDLIGILEVFKNHSVSDLKYQPHLK